MISKIVSSYILLLQLGKADLVSHKFRRKSKFKVSQNDKIPSAHNPASSALSSVSAVARGDDDCLSALNRGDTELSAELLGSGSLSELSSVEKLSSVSSPAPSLFADDNMEVFHPRHPPQLQLQPLC